MQIWLSGWRNSLTKLSRPEKAISHERHVYTILNEKGEYYATYKTRYNNKSVFIDNVKALICMTLREKS
jgi:hypothetical protein